MAKFTEQDKAEASAALTAWLRSQELTHGESVQVMLNVIGFSLARGAKNTRALKQRLIIAPG